MTSATSSPWPGATADLADYVDFELGQHGRRGAHAPGLIDIQMTYNRCA